MGYSNLDFTCQIQTVWCDKHNNIWLIMQVRLCMHESINSTITWLPNTKQSAFKNMLFVNNYWKCWCCSFYAFKESEKVTFSVRHADNRSKQTKRRLSDFDSSLIFFNNQIFYVLKLDDRFYLSSVWIKF